MDEDRIDEEEFAPKEHDRWSVLIIGLNGLTQLATTVANTFEQYTVMAAQHSNQKTYDRKFNEIAKWEE